MDQAVGGDALVVTGAFGGSIHGRHLSFQPRVQLALYLAENYEVHAATDVSDSLSLDLSSIGLASGVGFDLDLDAIPISTEVRLSDSMSALQHALGDGEDFELILTVPQHELPGLMADQAIKETLTVIGIVTDQHNELRAQSANGDWVKVEPRGYVH
jgi:thiamine-monophosphate kinase